MDSDTKNQERASIGFYTGLVMKFFGLDEAERFREELHGLPDHGQITLGDVERYLGRRAYLDYMGFDVVRASQ